MTYDGGRNQGTIKDPTSGGATNPPVTNVPDTTPPPATPPINLTTPTDNDAQRYLSDILGMYGLESEVAWAWDQIVQGHNTDYVLQQLRQRPAYKVRFKGMDVRAAKGLPAISENEYIQYERTIAQMMRTVNFPVGFYDQPDDFVAMIGNDVSVAEMSRRLTNVYDRVVTAPPEVRQYFDQLYGTAGDTALAMFVADPDKALPMLEQAATAGVFGGAGRLFQFDIGTNMAQRAGQFGLTDEQIYAGYQRLAELRPLMDQTVSETTDLNADTGAAAVFGLDANAAAEVQKRQQERQAQMAGVGGVLPTQQGLALGPGRQ